jgi:hypothetical protein
MTVKSTGTSGANEPKQRPTRLERRAAETAALANQQARLKQEAAARRVKAAKTETGQPRRGHRTTRG